MTSVKSKQAAVSVPNLGRLQPLGSGNGGGGSRSNSLHVTSPLLSPFESPRVQEARKAAPSSHEIRVGRFLLALRPGVVSFVDTATWRCPHKSALHLMVASYLYWAHAAFGIRSFLLLFSFHVWVTRDTRQSTDDEVAVRALHHALRWISHILPSTRRASSVVWGSLFAVAVAEVILYTVFSVSILNIVDAMVYPLSVLTIFSLKLLRPQALSDLPTFTNVQIEVGNNSFGLSSMQPTITPEPVCSSPELTPTTLSPRNGSFGPGSRLMLDGISKPIHESLCLYNHPKWALHKSESDGITCHLTKVPWCDIKAALYRTVYAPPVTFDDVVAIINDDDGVKPIKTLKMFKFDKLLRDVIRVKTIDKSSRIVQYLYKTPVIGVAPRDAALLSCCRHLTPPEQEYYGCESPTGHVFVLASSGLHKQSEVASPKGYQRSLVHRHMILVRDLGPGVGVEVVMLLSAEPGGNIPSWVIDLARGEQIKMLRDIRGLALEEVQCRKQNSVK